MSSVSAAFKVHYNQKLGDPSGHLGERTMVSGGIDAHGRYLLFLTRRSYC